MRTLSRPLPTFLLPPLLLLCLTLPHLGDGEFRRDTVRYAAVGHYAFDGGDPLALELRPGEPYFNKPPLPIWIHGAVLKVSGISLAAARLPSVLAAAGVVLLSMLCVRRLAGRNEAVASGFLLVLSYEFVRRTREISLDLWMLLFIMAATLLVASELRRPTRWRLAAAGGMLGLALLCKPLIALGAPPLYAIWFLLAKRRRRVIPMLLWTLGVATLVALPWHVYMATRFGDAFLGQYFGDQIVARAQGEHGEEGVFFYLTMSEWALLAWLLAILGAWVWYRRRPRRGADRNTVAFAWTWALGLLVALSAFADKKPNYLLPAWPFLSWAAAYGLCRLRVPGLTRWHRAGYPWLASSAVAVALAVQLVPAEFQSGRRPELALVLDWLEAERGEAAFENLAADGVPPNHYCFTYVRTGRWPLPQAGPGDYMINRRGRFEERQLLRKEGRLRLWDRAP